jgi:hypothetical protein
MKIIWRLENTRNFSILKDDDLNPRGTWKRAELPQEMVDKYGKLLNELDELESEINEYLSNPPRI